MEFHDSSLADEARRRRVGLVNLLRHLREHWLFSKCSGMRGNAGCSRSASRFARR